MAATKLQIPRPPATTKSYQAQPGATPPSQDLHAFQPDGKKKKKNKKGKGQAQYTDQAAGNATFVDDHLGHMRSQSPGRTTHLHRDSESIHLSATLTSSATGRVHGDAIPQAEFHHKMAYQHHHFDPSADFNTFDNADFDCDHGHDHNHLNSLPTQIRNFVQTAWASIAGIGNDDIRQRTMYAIAQQMVQSGMGLGIGVGINSGSNGKGLGRDGLSSTPTNLANYPPPGAYPPFPFDPSAFADPSFPQALEQAMKDVGLTGLLSSSPGQPPRGPLPPTSTTTGTANIVYTHEFREEFDDYGESEYFSEDEDDDIEETRSHGSNAQVFTTGTEGKKKRKKQKRVLTHAGSVPVPAAAADRGRGERVKDVTKTVTSNDPHSHPMPATRPTATATTAVATNTTTANNNPPPSSRAAGKQPMAYPPPNTNTQANAAAQQQQPPRSARAASKAPANGNNNGGGGYQHNHPHHHPSPPSSNASQPQKHRPPGSQTNVNSASKQQPNKIWSTNSSEERERIKEFWLKLGEEDRRALVKVEKEAVLKKMKEQQKHSCSCAVCGRKRNAIEEELEVLYDAYYEELEQYANKQQQYASSGGSPPLGPGPFPGSVELDENGAIVVHPVGHHHYPSGRTTHPHHHPKHVLHRGDNKTNHNGVITTNGRKKVTESEFDEDEGDGDEYEEEDYDDEEEDEEEDEEDDGDGEDDVVDSRRGGNRRGVPPPRGRHAAPNGKANGRDDLFNFGSSLTVTGPGNILTVADDLLKNDGQKFLEMMEQLAERRMQREEEAANDIEDDSDEDDDDEGDEDDDDDDGEEEEEEEAMTEEQKMKEGKRMFSIFAARMFEQRVLQAYREKVAQERQLQLLRELEDEDKLTKEREAKKQKENQKKKDKKRQQKQAKEGERAAKAAEKAAEEEAAREKQRKAEEESRRRREEERLKREASRKQQEEERQKKDEERRKRIAEEKEREVERERRRKEREERLRAERKERDEKERKAREEKQAAERAEKLKREQQEKEDRERRLAKEREEKAEKEAKERLALHNQQQRAASKPRSPTSPRNNNNAVASGSSSRSQPTAQTPKKILNKPPPVAPLTQATAPRVSQRSSISSTQPSTPVSPQPPSQSASQISLGNVSPSTPVYSPVLQLATPSLSPRVPFTPTVGSVPPSSYMNGPNGGSYMGMPPVVTSMAPPSLAPSALPRNFGGLPSYDPNFGRGLAPSVPIGPPPKVGLPNPMPPPIGSPIPSGPPGSRRLSGASTDPGPLGPGPITRPIAPIARPFGGDASGSGSGSGAASPTTRRSPSPKGILGSSALAADDDEVVSQPSRRIVQAPVGTAVGVGWSSPRSAIGVGAPWGASPHAQLVGPGQPPPPPQGFSSRPPPPQLGGSVWGNANPNGDWMPSPHHHHPNSAFFGVGVGGQFVTHNPSPPPHT